MYFIFISVQEPPILFQREKTENYGGVTMLLCYSQKDSKFFRIQKFLSRFWFVVGFL